jgi:hypothetical protein
MEFFFLFPDAGTNRPAMFIDKTFYEALENIAIITGNIFNSAPNTHRTSSIPYSNEQTLVFMFMDSNYKQEEYKVLKKQRPNSKLVIIGGDTHYMGNLETLYIMPADLYIDPMKLVAAAVNVYHQIPTSHFWWTLSQKTIEDIQQRYRPSLKMYDMICLCNVHSGMLDRVKLFNELKRRNFIVKYNLKENNWDNIINLYSSSYVTLGTTTCCIGYGPRSMKGFRDYIGPLCNSLLMCDNYRDIVESLSDIIPTYKYMHFDDLSETYDKLVLLSNGNEYKKYIEIQKDWVINHSLDVQLLDILQEHNIL